MTKHEILIVQKMQRAAIVLAKRAARKEIERQIRARGERLHDYSAKDLALMAEVYFAGHMERLIAEARQAVELMRREGFFGKRGLSLTPQVSQSWGPEKSPVISTEAIFPG
jgi:hypothetical protein